jgi:hypothetical protein
MADVFISYARDDRETAAKLAKVLQEQGYSVWWDRVIPPGKKWAEIIGTQLGAARCVVVLWSAVSVEKRWVHKEASFADARNKLIPVRLEDVTIPFEFADVQAADLTEWQGDDSHEGFQHLASAISEQLRKPISKHPEEDIVVATEQAEEQLAESQGTQRRPAATGAKTGRPSVRAAWDRFSAYMRMPGWQTLLSKRTIIIGGISVVLAVSLFMLASQEAGQKPAVIAPGVTDAPGSGGANNGTANIGQPGQAVDLANPSPERELGPAPTTTTGSIVVRAEQKGARFSIHDGARTHLASASVNNPVSLFPGSYKVKINGSESETSVKAGQEATLETGSIVVRAEEKGARFFIHDGAGTRLASASVNDPVSLFPGTYKLQFRGSERVVSVQAGQRTF